MQLIYDIVQGYQIVSIKKTVTCPAVALIDADKIIKEESPIGDVLIVDGDTIQRINNPEKD